MKHFVKLPVRLFDQRQADIGVKAEEAEGYGYYDITKIVGIRQGHDDSVSDMMNTEGTVIEFTDGNSLLVYLNIEDVMDLIRKQYDILVSPCTNYDPHFPLPPHCQNTSWIK